MKHFKICHNHFYKTGVTNLEEVVEGTILIQECIPEVLSLKQQLYDQIDKIVGSQTIISSSTSTFLPSALSEKMEHRNQLIVSHPVCKICIILILNKVNILCIFKG